MQNTNTAMSFVDNKTIQLRMELGRVTLGKMTDELPTGGETAADGFYYVNGVATGRIGGRNGDQWRPLDKIDASPIADLFDAKSVNGVIQAIADNPARWIVTVNGEEVAIETLSRKTHIHDTARTGVFDFEFTSLENVFLKLDRPIPPGADISVRLRDADFTAITGSFEPATTVSEAIHVNLRGFDPNDGHKAAYLSSWNGWQVDGAAEGDGRSIAQDYAAGMTFKIIDNATGRVALTGTTTVSDRRTELSDLNENFFGTDVFKIDFSALDDTGSYHILVDGVGRSNDFTITDIHWDDIFGLGMSGYYHQRSGIALEQPYTDWERPRSFHPDDGVVIHETTVKISEHDMGYDNTRPIAFEAFGDNMTGNTLPQAWGGWHDAGDWDRRTQHIEVVREMTELWSLTNPSPRFPFPKVATTSPIS
jgi:endoglucanase